ncbi:phospholipid/cholesterol/gamma-HCH transport system substrate-binding protein [Jatrophihabitans sp. GAS493]|uniref:MCE family protein n=1 Tax=Jatrophihabitans sp. GAS493 TaxID=1907575 RepID=UPI000BB9420F|nr:MCE family protein [Jatrophihabitans sp. GAS493]SOD72378.1 phospholipid/cholesterol/gamma-HCH transport system substrate-binding protein [Jatrophihabitans sp. GAS493]
MLKRSVKIQLTAFFIIALLGVSYVGARYAGIETLIFGRGGCTISADFPDSGGIFTNAEVTYRGVGIGKVGELHLLKDGVRADLDLKSCSDPNLPQSTSAIVADRSAVGEQYVNLVAAKDVGPYLQAGGNLPMSQNEIPIATQVFITNLDNLTKSVNPVDLKKSLHELDLAFNNKGPDLAVLADSITTLINRALIALPDTISLIQTSDTVLKTQVAEGSAIGSWASDLNKLTATLKSSDGDIRTLLDNGPSAFAAIKTFVQSNQDDIGVLFANLTTLGQVVTRNTGGVEQVLSLFPVAIADGLTALPGDGTLHFGFVPPGVRSSTQPPFCTVGYGGTKKRTSLDTSPAAPNTSAQCTDRSSVRGAANTPGGDTMSTAGGGTVYPRANTANVVRVGDISNPSAQILGDSSWVTILSSSMH